MPGRVYISGSETREGYTGHEPDLDYAGARYYMPALGRWTSVDPLADEFPAWSPYNYVMNDPVGVVDPDGRVPVPLIIAGKFAAGFALDAGAQFAANVALGQSPADAFRTIDFGDAALAGV